ncbi:hypothetical protein GCM10009601_01730 [Streptomyces thermospinosisporus]|uniref:HTH luxR-type domain-containing protein n=2 Tax=Streptomyces thermospinosisporus TaxID=161482 RepID=A0ABP4J638_9ACTN
MANRALARRLGIAERTVKAHVAHIIEKLGLSTRLEAAVVAAVHHELICPERHSAAGQTARGTAGAGGAGVQWRRPLSYSDRIPPAHDASFATRSVPAISSTPAPQQLLDGYRGRESPTGPRP